MKTLLPFAAAALLSFGPVEADDGHTKDIVDTAVAAGSFGTLAAALESAELVQALKGEGPFTVFAPTDDAFAKLPKETLQALLLPENRAQLTKVLTYHVVSGNVSARQAVTAGKAPSLQKGELTFRIDEGRLRVNDAAVLSNDIECANGVIHVIDSVLLPPGDLQLRPPGRLVIGVNLERPSRALAEQLGLDRQKTLLVTGVTSKGAAERAHIEKYDLITSIDGQPATNANLDKAKDGAGYGGRIELTIVRRGEARKVTVGVGVESH